MPKIKKIPIKILDAVPIILTLAVIALFSIRAYGGAGTNLQVRIQTPAGEFLYPLDKELTLHMEGPLGETEVYILNGSVRVTTSPCREKVCISVGTLSRSGAWLACLPNWIFVQVEGIDDEEIDAVSF